MTTQDLLGEAEAILCDAHLDYLDHPEYYTVRGEILDELTELLVAVDSDDPVAVKQLRDAIHYLVG